MVCKLCNNEHEELDCPPGATISIHAVMEELKRLNIENSQQMVAYSKLEEQYKQFIEPLMFLQGKVPTAFLGKPLSEYAVFLIKEHELLITSLYDTIRRFRER